MFVFLSHMSKILMIYHIPKGDASTRISFNRKLFCYRIQSNSGKFDKISDGILKKFKKPVRSTVIFNESKIKNVKKICTEFNIMSKFYKIQEIKD